MKGDIVLSRDNIGTPFPCPVCDRYPLNEDFDKSKHHLERHGYLEMPSDPNEAAKKFPGRPTQDPVVFRKR